MLWETFFFARVDIMGMVINKTSLKKIARVCYSAGSYPPKRYSSVRKLNRTLHFLHVNQNNFCENTSLRSHLFKMKKNLPATFSREQECCKMRYVIQIAKSKENLNVSRASSGKYVNENVCGQPYKEIDRNRISLYFL